MAKPNTLPTKTSSRERQLRGLNHGNPGNRGGTGRPDLAFRIRAQTIMEKAAGLEVMGKVLSGDILEFLGEKDGELVIGQTRNADRIAAFRELRDAAGYGSPKPVSVEASGDVKILVVYEVPPALGD